MFLLHQIPAKECWLDTHYLFNGDLPADYPSFEKCVLISVKSKRGFDLEFQVLTERGVLRDKLPISALSSSISFESNQFFAQDELQRWCCPSFYLSVIELPLGTGKAWIRQRQMPFEYWFTVDFCHVGSEIDLTDTSIPEEHKCMHVVALKNGQIAALPNNSLVWDHATLVSEASQLKANPGYKAACETYSVERYKLAGSPVSQNLHLYDAGFEPAIIY
jgi:hypothetical protein